MAILRPPTQTKSAGQGTAPPYARQRLNERGGETAIREKRATMYRLYLRARHQVGQALGRGKSHHEATPSANHRILSEKQRGKLRNQGHAASQQRFVAASGSDGVSRHPLVDARQRHFIASIDQAAQEFGLLNRHLAAASRQQTPAGGRKRGNHA